MRRNDPLARRLIVAIVAALAGVLLGAAAPRPWGLLLWTVMVLAWVVWSVLPRRPWHSYRPPSGWTFTADDPEFVPPPRGAFDGPAGRVRSVLRGTHRGWPLVAWEEEVGARYQWRCALDVGVDLPAWSARPLRELYGSQPAPFPEGFEFSPSMHPELKRAMGRQDTNLAWSTRGTFVVAEVERMSPAALPRWLDEQGRLLAEIAAILRTELSPHQLRLAPTPPALTRGGPARNEWTPDEFVADPTPDGAPVPVERAWRQPDFGSRSGHDDGHTPPSSPA